MKTLIIFFFYCFIAQTYLLCYQCVSTHPGCGTPFKWLWHKTVSCPEEDDICVKVIEKIGGNWSHNSIPTTSVYFNNIGWFLTSMEIE